jgi:hypothetical protein
MLRASCRRGSSLTLGKMKIILLFLGIFYSATILASEKQISKFSELQPNERIVIRYISSGCYREAYAAELIFYPKKNGCFYVDELTLRWSETRKDYDVQSRKRIGHVDLAPEEVKKVDALIAYYRKPEAPEFTLHHDSIHLRIRQMRGRKLIHEESFIDPYPSFTASKLQDELSLITFGEMIGAIKNAGR